MAYTLPKLNLGSNPDLNQYSNPQANGMSNQQASNLMLLGNTIVNQNKRTHLLSTIPELHQVRSPFGHSRNDSSNANLNFQINPIAQGRYDLLPMGSMTSLHGGGSPHPMSQPNMLTNNALLNAGMGIVGSPQHFSPVQSAGSLNGGQPPYYIQPIIIKNDKDKKGRYDDDSDSDDSRDYRRRKRHDRGRDRDRPMEHVLDKFMDRQNNMLEKLMRDMQEDRRMDAMRQQQMQLEEKLKFYMNQGQNQQPPQQYMPQQPPPYQQPYPQSPPKVKPYFPEEETENPWEKKKPYRNNSDLSSMNNKRNEAPKKSAFKPQHERIRARRLLKGFGWGLALPGLWFISVVKWAEKRRDHELQVLKEEIPGHLETFLEFAAVAIGNEIQKFATEKKSMVLIQSGKLSASETDKRCQNITDYLVQIFDHLSLQLDGGQLPPAFFEFLAAISKNNAVLPENFLSGFELFHLSFNSFGNLKDMNEWKSKMIVACFLILKGVLYFLVMRSWTIIHTIKEEQVNVKNTLNAGSVLYHLVLDLLQQHLTPIDPKLSNSPFKVAPPSFQALDDDKLKKIDILPESHPHADEEVILGFYDRDLVAEYFNRPQMVKQVEETIKDFLDVLYDMSNNALDKTWHVKRAFAEHRPVQKR